jgi:hypothetical protein
VSFDRDPDLKETIRGGPQLPIDDERPAGDSPQGVIALIGLRDTLLPCVSTEHPQSPAVEDSDRHAGSGVAASNSESCR